MAVGSYYGPCTKSGYGLLSRVGLHTLAFPETVGRTVDNHYREGDY